MMKFINNGKSPDTLHDFLVENKCKPVSLCHNTQYSEDGNPANEATEIYIEIEPEKEELLADLVNQFMSH